MGSFWDSSWESIDPERIAEYVSDFDLEADGIIDYLHEQGAKTVCDAGCGCGIYALKLASNGFTVSGFDVSAHAVEIARKLLEEAPVKAELKTASILETGYSDNQFDGVVSRDVVDHMGKADAMAAIRELCRITKPGGVIVITLDHPDEEYETEPHIVNADGDYVFTAGKWEGMVFHPYSEQEVMEMIPAGTTCHMENGDEIVIKLTKTPA